MPRIILFALIVLSFQSCKEEEKPLPNILFVMMDDLGFGQFGLHNDTLSIDDFDPYFVRRVNENQSYSPEQALAFSKLAMPTMNKLASAMDILPPLIDAAGGSIPESIDGKSLLPLLSGQSNEPVHDQLVWAGLHARAWGFLINTSYRGHGDERNYAPPAWTVIKDDYLLRYVGEIETDLYREIPEGKGAKYELFNLVADPDETQNLASEMPEKVTELTSVYFKEANDFAPPVVWKRRKWEEIRPEKMKD